MKPRPGRPLPPNSPSPDHASRSGSNETSSQPHAARHTEAKHEASAVLEAEHFLQSTLDALSSHIAILDEHGTIIKVNSPWTRFA